MFDLGSLVRVVSVAVALACAGGCAVDPSGEGEVADTVDHLTQESDALVLDAANSLDEDTLDLEVGLGATAAHAVVKGRPFATVNALRTVLTAPRLRLLLNYARQNNAGWDSGARPTTDGGAGATWDASAPDGNAWSDASTLDGGF